MSLVILTKSPTCNLKDFLNQIKKFFKFLFGQNRGPSAVTASLRRGLKELAIKYIFNPSLKKIKVEDTAYINESPAALKKAVAIKEKGKIKKLVAGPAISVLPDEEERIMRNENIDIILLPCQWVKDYWISLAPELSEKIFVWPAGVPEYPAVLSERKKVLLYQKTGEEKLFEQIKEFLQEQKVDFEIIRYGRYDHKKFLQSLDQAKAMIFLSQSESQGLALAEAWMKGVPTFVWSKGYWQYKNIVWKEEKISAPYLNEKCGRFFKDFDDFKNTWPEFVNALGNFTPRQYALENFTDKICAENFLEITTER